MRMWSAISSLLWRGKESSDENAVPNLEEDDEEESSESEQETECEPLVLQGHITVLDDCLAKGVIDGKYSFEKSKFAHLKLKRGMLVDFTATCSESSSFGEVTAIQPVVSEKQRAIEERAKYQTLNCKVSHIDREESIVEVKRGKDDSGICLPFSLLPQDYPVCEGDWLEIKMKAVDNEYTANGGEATEATILSVNWTEQRISEGIVTIVNKRTCIDGTIFFTQDVVEKHKILKRDEKVRVVSVASDQEEDFRNPGMFQFKKRALSVTHSTFLKYNPSTHSPSEDTEEEWIEEEPEISRLETKFHELLKDKSSVRVRPFKVVSFKAVKIGSTVEKTISVENANDSFKRVILKNIYLLNNQDVCKFTIIIEKTEGSGVIATLGPRESFSFKISCTPEQLGRTKEFCILDFGDFKIGRILAITALSDEEEAIKSMRSKAGAGMDWKKKREAVNNAPMSMIQQQNMRTIRGAQAVRTPFFLPHRIPANSVPQNLTKIYRNAKDEDLMHEFPNVKNWNELNPENYVTRFQVALWFEEIENDNLRRQYDVRDIILRPVGDCLVFDVEGIKDFHPPVLQGDPVRCFLSKNLNVNYEGPVQKIVFPDSAPPQVYVKFNEKLHKTYDGSPVTVQFCLGRTTFKRQHFAVLHAVSCLGMDWLFPTALKYKPPRIFFQEQEDEHESTLNDSFAGDPNTSTKFSSKRVQLNSSRGRVDRRAASLRGPVQSVIQDPKDLGMVTLKWFNKNLNTEQRDAVRRILRGEGRPLPYVIFGPPGTGKTVTVVEAILQIYTLEKASRILVTVPSNAGADVIAEHLVATEMFKPGEMVRLNGFIRSECAVPETIVDFCQDGEFLDSIAKHRLIICTVSTAGQFFQLNINTGHFSHVFIDEAGYCTEPEAMIPSVLAAIDKEGQIILAGDPEQLGPVLMCDLRVNDILGKSFLERIMETPVYERNEALFPDTKYNPAVLTKLVKSYRAHEKLLKLPSEMFYNDELVSCASKEDAYTLCENLDLFPPSKDADEEPKPKTPLLFHGCQGTCLQESDSPSWFNLAEVAQVVKYVKLLRSHGLSNDDIGIITPYRKQVEKVRIHLSLILLEDDLPKIASVQEFQGGERKVMIISTVRSDYEDTVAKKLNRLEFLYSKKRFNVAITRAKALMIIVGNPHVLVHNPYWERLLKYAVELRSYTGCELPKKLDPKWNNMLSEINNSNGSVALGSNNDCSESNGTHNNDDSDYCDYDEDDDDEESNALPVDHFS